MLKNYLAKLFAKTNRKFTNFMDLASNNFADTRNYYAGIESYQKNVIVFRCVNLIAQSASHVPWIVPNVLRAILSQFIITLFLLC